MIEFREHDHTYWYQGARVPSVTQVMQMLIDFSWVPREVLDRKSELGKAVHLMIHLYEHDDLDMATVDLELIPYLEAWQKFKHDAKFITLDSECVVHSRAHRYAGTLDLCGSLAGNRVIIDIKTTATLHPAIGLQTAAYAKAYEEQHKFLIQGRYALKLSPAGYKLEQYTNRSDFSVFQSCLTLNNWRFNNAS